MHHPRPNASRGGDPGLVSLLLALLWTTKTSGCPAKAVLRHQTVLVQAVARHPLTNASPYPRVPMSSYLGQIRRALSPSPYLACPLSVLQKRPRRHLCQLHVHLKLCRQRLRHRPVMQRRLLRHSIPSLNHASWRHVQRTPRPFIGRIIHRTNAYR